MNHAQFWGGAAAPYEIEQSLRFDGSASLSRSLGTTSSSWTVSFWTKVAQNDSHDGYWFNTSQTAIYIDASSGATSDRRWKIRDNSTGTLVVSNALVRDPSAWYHVVYKCDGSNRRLYINNSLDAGFTFSGSTTLSGSSVVGGYYTGSGAKLEGYIAEFHLVDGTALDPTDFGEYDDNGVWRPIEYTGSHGTQGFYLKFDPSATNGIGHDHSGNGNNWTPNNFTTSGTGTDVMSDTPTTNYCTLNPIGTTYGLQAPTDGNLKTDSNAYGKSTEGTFGIPKDGNLYYFEGTMTRAVGDGGTGLFFGCHTQGTTADPNSSSGKYFGPYGTDGSSYDGAQFIWKYDSYTGSAKYGHINAGTVLAHAIKYDSGTWKYWYRQGSNGWHYWDGSSWVYNTSFDETEPTGSNSSVPESETLVPIGNNIIFNFGQRDFEYTPPTGAKFLRSSDLPAPDIADGSDYFNTVLWTGTGGTGQSITGVGFQPDLVWIKDRNVGYDHVLQDAVRGTGEDKKLYSSRTDSETSAYKVYGNVSSFDTNGFTVANGSSGDQHVNQNTYPYVAWNWLGANGTSSNTDGTITSTVSVNPTAGFSIVSYTGNVTAGATVGHGLGVAPEMIIVKNRDTSGYQWPVYHKDVGATKYLYLSDTRAALTYQHYWNNTAPSSTVFTLGTDIAVNGSGDNIIAYCFAEVEGYSKFGSYTGNGSTDGPFVFCGFKPQWILLKSANGGSWELYDTARDTYNQSEKTLEPNSSAVEGSGYPIDILSNGFKVRTSNSQINYSSYTYIFAAFAEHPTGGSGVSPATAR